MDCNYPSNIYYNIELYGSYSNGQFKQKIAYTKDIKSETIISKPCEYYASIVRFSIPGTALPLTIYPSEYDLSVTIRRVSSNSTFKTNLIFTPYRLGAQPTDEDYYYIYNVQTLINMINTAFETSYNALNAAFPGSLAFSPYIIYDSEKHSLSIVTPYTNIENGNIDIFFNTGLYQRYLVGFNVMEYSRNSSTGCDFKLLTKPSPGNFNGYAIPGNALTNPPAALIWYENFKSLTNWSSVQSFIFASTSLPIQEESIPSDDKKQSNMLNLFPAITDFEPLVTNTGDIRTQLQYYPQGPYRLVDMIGTKPITTIDIQVFWKDKNGKTHELKMEVGSVITIKFLFTKKSA